MAYTVMTLLLAGASLSFALPSPPDAAADPRPHTAKLELSNPFDASKGKWGPVEFCPNNSFVRSYEMKLEPDGAFDNTAVNAWKLYCVDATTGLDTAWVSSSQGDFGDWLGGVRLRPGNTGRRDWSLGKSQDPHRGVGLLGAVPPRQRRVRDTDARREVSAHRRRHRRR